VWKRADDMTTAEILAEVNRLHWWTVRLNVATVILLVATAAVHVYKAAR
jgi:hypothetical protein